VTQRDPGHEIVREQQRPGDPEGRPLPPATTVRPDPLEDAVIHGAGDPPRDALADATRRLVVDDHEARLGTEPLPREPLPESASTDRRPGR
jgi:hypothetical protein